MHIFRVIVRGRFGELTAEQQAELREQLALDGDLAAYRFAPDGVLAYDNRLDFLSVRVEARVEGEGSSTTREAAFAAAESTAQRLLATRGLPWRHLSTTGADMADVWK